MTVLPLKGYKSLRAMNAFHSLLLGLKMLPDYGLIPYEKFFENFKNMEEHHKETLLREAIVFVELSEDEVQALISFATDSNGVPYGTTNLKNLNPSEIHETIVAVCMEIGRIKIDLLSEAEKKSFLRSV